MYGFDLLQQGLALIPIAVGTVFSFLLYMLYLVFLFASPHAPEFKSVH